jgi:hypothetical protein
MTYRRVRERREILAGRGTTQADLARRDLRAG